MHGHVCVHKNLCMSIYAGHILCIYEEKILKHAYICEYIYACVCICLSCIWNVFMYIHIYAMHMLLHMSLYVYLSAFKCISVCMYVYICMHAYTFKCISVHSVYMLPCACIVCVCTCMSICAHIYM